MSKFKVGQKWRARSGHVFEIIKVCWFTPFPIRAKLTGTEAIVSVDKNGAYAGKLLYHGQDLLELVFDPAAPTCSDSTQSNEGQRADPFEQFTAKANAFVAAQTPWTMQANELEGEEASK